MTMLFLVLAVAFLAWANGGNDNFKSVATVYASRTLGFRSSLKLATIAQVAGSVASLFLGAALVRAFGGKGILAAELIGDPRVLTAIAGGAATVVILGTVTGMPLSTTHALIGALLGTGLMLGPSEIMWPAVVSGLVLPLLTSPLLALALAGLAYPVCRSVRQRLGVTETTCLCVGGKVEPVLMQADGSMRGRRTGLTLTQEQASICKQVPRGSVFGISARSLVDGVHAASAFAMGFARGLNDTPKILALLVAGNWSGLDPRISLAVIATAMAAGGWIQSRKVADTLGRRITPMNPGQGLVANGLSSFIIIGASLMGMPVSTTHVSTGSIFGIGLWTREANWRLVSGIVLAWGLTLPLAALAAAAIGAALS